MTWEASAHFGVTRKGLEELAAAARRRRIRQHVSEVLRVEENERLWGFVVWTPPKGES